MIPEHKFKIIIYYVFKFRFVFLLAFFAILFSVFYFARYDRTDSLLCSVSFLDVGQGDSILIKSNKRAILIDTGKNKEKLLKALSKELEQNFIDFLIITHNDKDHYGAMNILFDRYKVKFAHLPYNLSLLSLNDKDVELISFQAGDSLHIADNVYLDILHPYQGVYGKNDNLTSFVSELFCGPVSFLFMADTPSSLENYLQRKYDLRADVIKIAHHGSKYSSDFDFLQALGLKYAVLSYGKNNYGMPDKKVLNNLKKLKIKVFKTQENGNIKFSVLKDGELKVETEK